jgi:multidrug efflux pump subunit AcrB
LQNQNIISFQDTHNYKEIHYLTFGVEKEFISNIENLKNYSFTNGNWEKIYLKNIAKFTTQLVPGPITTDKKQPTHSIYAEMWDNSVVYPIISLMSLLKKDDFLWENLKVVKSNFYEIIYFDTQTSLEYKILWDGEWKITMDTFRDLGTAMILSLLVIYFLMVAQFKSFWVGWLIMLPFLLWFYGIFPGFSLLYIFDNQYFNATGMIWIISLWWIVVGNAILLIDYINIRKNDWVDIKNAIIEAGMIRFLPILLTNISAIFWAIKIVWDPVWSWLAWSIVFGLSSSAILTLLILPIFYYDSQKNFWKSQKNT